MILYLTYCFNIQNAPTVHMAMRALNNAAFTARTKKFVITKLEFVQTVAQMVIPEAHVTTVSRNICHLEIILIIFSP
jgi:hypothetical protein